MWGKNKKQSIFQYDDILEYHIKKDSVFFTCPSAEDNAEVAALINGLLLEMSKEHTVFFYGYRLPAGGVTQIIDPSAILDNAEMILDPFKTFFHLREARIRVEHSDNACESTVYFFEKEVRWPDFLATSVLHDLAEFMKKGKLKAYFASTDQGADYRFECSRVYEEKLMGFFRSVAEAGYVVRRI